MLDVAEEDADGICVFEGLAAALASGGEHLW